MREIRLGWIPWTVVAVSAVLAVLSMGVPAFIDHPLTTESGEIRLYLDVLYEANLPTWWSTVLLVTGALVHAVAATVAWNRSRGEATAWLGTSAVLALLSLDELTSLHERLDTIGEQVATFERYPFYWVVPGLVIAALLMGAIVVLARALDGRARLWLLAGLALLLGSALGGELVQGSLLAVGDTGPVYVLTYHAEEFGESMGALLMLVSVFSVHAVLRTADGIAFVNRAAGRGARADAAAAADGADSPRPAPVEVAAD